MDFPAFLSFLMLVLLASSCIFWTGAQLWHFFIPSSTATTSQARDDQQTKWRFQRFFAVPLLLLILFANIGTMVGQSMALAGGDLGAIPEIAMRLLTNSRTGIYWILRESIAFLALILTLLIVRIKTQDIIDELLSWILLACGLGLLTTLALTGPAINLPGTIQGYAMLLDGLSWLALTLWAGSLLYAVLIYLPALQATHTIKNIQELLTLWTRSALLLLPGSILLIITGIVKAFLLLEVPEQLLTSVYGRILLVKAGLVVLLLLLWFIQMLWLRPELVATTKQESIDTNLTTLFKRSASIMRWQALIGCGLLICSGLLSVFASIPQAPSQKPQTTNKPFNATVQTVDRKFTLEVQVDPNRFGVNTFTIQVLNEHGEPAHDLTITLYSNMVEMDMGTEITSLQPAGDNGTFKGEGIFSMGGLWQLRIQIQTDTDSRHEARLQITVPY